MDKNERILKRLMRRSQKTAQAFLQPLPISGFGELKYMITAKGKIGKLVCIVENFPKSGVTLRCVHKSKTHNRTIDIILNKPGILIQDLDLSVEVTDRILIRVDFEKEEDSQDYYVGFLYTIEPKEAEVKQFLIDELDKLEESYAEEVGETT